ncbi:hypothetical protein BKA64DRAFT_634210 [Cadophora sp. MPI-SDFR-AT-0126]|nr:hypothetical protein BKA64DRAFT_634210 [Leotiomycetes sp. MPI-SDFR-AT-0126]
MRVLLRCLTTTTSTGKMNSRSSRRELYGRRLPSIRLPALPSNVPAPQSTSTAVLLVSEDGQAPAAIQVGATTFTSFPSMPLELRLKVWGYTFEEREAVCLEHKVYKSDVNDDSTKAFILENNKYLPAALFVNQESRGHAVSKHTIVFRSQIAAPVKFDGLRPICAKTSDVFWVEFITIMNTHEELYEWLSALKTHKPGFLDKITRLEVRGTFTQMFFVGVLTGNMRECLLNPGADPLQKMMLGSFLLFPALKEITFTGKRGDMDWVTGLGRLQLEQLKAWIVKFLEKCKNMFTLNGKEAPTVTFRPFKTFQQVIDE